tara:strand:- start:17774 stop:17899 length:126 start_codon:yes stop_codon:yes gene_type:complete
MIGIFACFGLFEKGKSDVEILIKIAQISIDLIRDYDRTTFT